MTWSQFVHHRLGDDVHRPARHVPGEQRDAVGVGLEAEVLRFMSASVLLLLPHRAGEGAPKRADEGYADSAGLT